MKMKTTLLFLTLILFACSPGLFTPSPSPTQHTPIGATNATGESSFPIFVTTDESSPPKIIVTVGTPNIGQPPDGGFPTPSTSQQDCGFSWAYHDLPELTETLDTSIKALNSNAMARATAFGEDCIGEGGIVVRFGAMETDFYVILSVSDLTDYESFGNWITQVMEVVNMLPPDMLAGPNSGFVEFRFEKTQSESIGFRVPIQSYNTTANGITGEELFHMFYTSP